MHTYNFSQGVHVNAKGARASIQADLGRYGKLSLKLKGAGASKRGSIPKGCTGTPGRSRAGTLSGSFKLVADSTYFKTIRAKTLKGQVIKGGTLRCDGSGSAPDERPTTLTASRTDAAGMLMFAAARAAGGSVTQTATRMDDAAATAPASIMHMISAPGGASAFAPAAGLGSATGGAVAPFFTGAFAFAADTTMGTTAMGKLSGDLTAAFDSIGAQPIAAGGPDAIISMP
jgi:hypothetical protein